MIDLEEAKEIRYHACERKTPLTKNIARALARQHTRQGHPKAAYRCSFSTDHHWHFGTVPNMERLEKIAQAIRVLAQQEGLKDVVASSE